MKPTTYLYFAALSIMSLFITGFGGCGSVGRNDSRSVTAQTVVAYYAMLDEINPLYPCQDCIEASELPESLVIPPGHYWFSGRIYECFEEGLVRFSNPWVKNEQRIVYDGNLLAVISGFAWIQSHGYSDGGKPQAMLTEEATYRKLSMACGHVSAWAAQILSDFGIPAHVIAAKTLEPPNGYNDGHVMIEVFNDDWGKWVLYDIDCNAYFIGAGELPLSLDEFLVVSQTGEYRIESLAADPFCSVLDLEKDSFSWGFIAERLVDETQLRAWYRRVCQIAVPY